MSGLYDFPKFPLPQQVGPFRVEKMLSDDGNMARIFEGKTVGGRRIAVKIARSDDPTYTNLIRDEVEQLFDLRHPGIVHIYPINLPDSRKVVSVGRASGLAPHFKGFAPWYYAMELINGGSMERHRKRGTFINYPHEWKVELLYQLAVILKYLHGVGVAHRDLNMNNIMFRTPPAPNKAPEPVLIDFGLSAYYNREPHVRAGTISYVSPDRVESLKGIKAHYRTSLKSDIDHRPADVWALGVMIYELLLGKHPFEPFKNEDDLAVNILHKPVTPLNMPELDRILLGKPETTNSISNDRLEGMLSKVRENRLKIDDVITLIDTETPFLPPRIAV